MAGALDIVGHELTHGLTDFSSGLISQNESGALDESFSDILGTSVEFFYQPPGSGSRQADYLIGEDVLRPGGARSMSNPGAFGDPDHYSRRLITTEDNGGIHSNCGISNQAFYLAIEGGTNRTSNLSVQGVGAATFSTARAATIQAARELYPGSNVETAVTQAWTAVGVQ
jgi:thermolysin